MNKGILLSSSRYKFHLTPRGLRCRRLARTLCVDFVSNTALKYLRVWDGLLCLGTELREQEPGGGGDAMKIVERIPAHYAVQEVDQLGRAYRWCPERAVVECGTCGKRTTFNRSSLIT